MSCAKPLDQRAPGDRAAHVSPGKETGEESGGSSLSSPKATGAFHTASDEMVAGVTSTKQRLASEFKATADEDATTGDGVTDGDNTLFKGENLGLLLCQPKQQG